MTNPICCESKHATVQKMQKIKSGVIALYCVGSAYHPYQAISADLFECPVCHHQVIAAFADQPYWHDSDGGPPPSGPNVYTIV